MKITPNDSWKQKIDPCLDRLAACFLDFIGQLEQSPSEGLPCLPEDIVQEVTGCQWQDFYKGEFNEGFMGFLEKFGLDKGIMGNFLEAVNSLDNPEKVLKICSSLVESLPEEESRAYYRRELEALSRRPAFKPDLDNVFEKETRDYFSAVFSLLLRYLLSEVEKAKPPQEGELEGEFQKPEVLMTFIGVLFFILPHIAQQKTIHELIARFSEGDDKALFKAVTLDKGFLFHDKAKARIVKAQLTVDTRFFKDLGKAVADTPLKRIGQHGKTYFVLSFFWPMGLYKLGSLELYRFLESCGIIPPHHPYAFEKFINRHIKPLYKS
ncbi:hypothetical protein KJ039_09015 [bacterium]|nr:hypothetical protein [bacterium]